MYDPDDETKVASILKYALNKQGVDKRQYFIGTKEEALRQHDKQCLAKDSQGNWSYFYIERGKYDEIVFPGFRDAAKYIYRELLWEKILSPWDYRKEWEKDTGLEF